MNLERMNFSDGKHRFAISQAEFPETAIARKIVRNNAKGDKICQNLKYYKHNWIRLKNF